MKKMLWLAVVFCSLSCGQGNVFSVMRIVDGRTIALTNGAVVTLENVSDIPDNVRILERYCKGNILLFDKDSNEITRITSEQITGIVYNSNGDCINDLLAGVREITDKKAPVIDPAAPEAASDKTVVKMQLQDGVCIIPAEIDGVPLDFIFDTGASMISLSSKEADALYSSGKIRPEDLVGKGQFVDANGGISDGTIVRLTSVKIGDRILEDVQACISQSQTAPLLFGQSALQKFGKVSIDYTKLEIIFE